MIIATIGHNDYQLENIEQAETIFRILSKATYVDENYELPSGQRWHKMSGHSSIKIEIVEGEPMEYEDAQLLIIEERKKRGLHSA